MKFIKEFITEWKCQVGWMQAFGCVFPWERILKPKAREDLRTAIKALGDCLFHISEGS
ncbi:hypothetical protein M0R72_00820 [Candidatus Pacearchaeota archaeon]|jgi:hypothetical protein|nr:hypothetical protein [Candidatus Pacearchaeota archaeon]